MKRWMLLCCYLYVTHLHANCVGRFVNPITDICWSCLFPITIGGAKVSASGEDTPNPGGFICRCPGLIPFGIPISFWEPVRLVDVTRTPYCMVGMGGMCLQERGIRNRGTVGNSHTNHMRQSFYQVHWYVYPVLYWLELLTNFVCMEKAQFDLAYITELDPLWNDDETAFIVEPESVLFANPLAQAACAADCLAATSGVPNDALFWCGGCQGSLYPFSGTVAAHVGGVQGSLLAVQRMIAKLHRQGLLWGTVGKEAWCSKHPMPIIKKPNTKHRWSTPFLPQAAGSVIRWDAVINCGAQVRSFLIKGRILVI